MTSLVLKNDLKGFSQAEIHDTVEDALRREARQARVRRDYFAAQCRVFEETYGFSSAAFMEKFESGELGDDAAYFDWFAAKRGYDLWERRYRILQELAA
ncbi:MAG: hypothetical protein GXP42_06055 [Chloroflexi bacterium]|nr:hypothetical protein [Chloroflexota bacterium]